MCTRRQSISQERAEGEEGAREQDDELFVSTSMYISAQGAEQKSVRNLHG